MVFKELSRYTVEFREPCLRMRDKDMRSVESTLCDTWYAT